MFSCLLPSMRTSFSHSASNSRLRVSILSFDFRLSPSRFDSRLQLPLHAFAFQLTPSTSASHLQLQTLAFDFRLLSFHYRLWVLSTDSGFQPLTLTSDIRLSPLTSNSHLRLQILGIKFQQRLQSATSQCLRPSTINVTSPLHDIDTLAPSPTRSRTSYSLPFSDHLARLFRCSCRLS